MSSFDILRHKATGDSRGEFSCTGAKGLWLSVLISVCMTVLVLCCRVRVCAICDEGCG